MQLCISKLRSVQGTNAILTFPYKPYYLHIKMFIYAQAVKVSMKWITSTYNLRSKFTPNVCLINVTCFNSSSCFVSEHEVCVNGRNTKSKLWFFHSVPHHLSKLLSDLRQITLEGFIFLKMNSVTLFVEQPDSPASSLFELEWKMKAVEYL